MKGLTKTQQTLLDFIREFIEKNHYSPSLSEIRDHFGYRSLSTVHEHLLALKKKEAIVSEKHSARSINLKEPITQEVQIPLVGQFASSHPIELFAQTQAFLSFHRSEVPHPEKSYVLQVRGESLSHELIQNLDYLLIEATPVLSPRDIGLFSLASGATLLKRYVPETEFIKLEPLALNSYSHTEVFRPYELKIQGKLILLKRSY